MDRVVAIAIGSNLGDRAAHLAFARQALAGLLDNVRVSSVVETAPIGVPDAQPPYLNAAAVGQSGRPARALLAELLRIERMRGRERAFPNAARTLDLDLILAGDDVFEEPGLIVPHPRFRERRFVLEPLAEIAPALRDPVSGLTVAELLRRLPPAHPAPRR
ncbi:MAG TPA: 2-amino-4-hydroxy-6-hydroxymethyldihydropteridine diphosphokinase [Vicinamibacterales bacterium]